MMEENTELTIVNNNNISDILQEIHDAFYDIPFENSQFQTEAFVIAAQVTPERAYRSIGLKMHTKIQAVLEAKHGRAKEDIDIEELQEKINNPDTNKFDKRRAELDIQFKLANRQYTDKLMNDAMIELNILYNHFIKLPKYTREEFEFNEKNHFNIKLQRQLKGITGAAEAMVNMEQDINNLFKIENKKQLTESNVIKLDTN